MSNRQADQVATLNLADYVQHSVVLAAETWLRHGITTRVAGLGLAEGNVGYTAPRDEADAWAMRQLWCRAIGVDPATMIRVRQIHGSTVHNANRTDLARGAAPDASESPIGDAVVTDVPNLALTTLHADCLAILVADPKCRAVGAIHAGWRSTVLDIAGETIRTMQTAFGSDPADVLVYIGPSIGFERYEVGADVALGWERRTIERPDILAQRGDRWHFDLKLANRALLEEAGVLSKNIETSSICTADDGDRWFSHRGQGPNTGRFASIISINGDI
ncbi:MAG TPA: peptidoglycan editing factor PgeF [Thermomicrobiales bacterium]|nr:peptidoglycan editing factor PgeF [Thermomicrobiales bacterium]